MGNTSFKSLSEFLGAIEPLLDDEIRDMEAINKLHRDFRRERNGKMTRKELRQALKELPKYYPTRIKCEAKRS